MVFIDPFDKLLNNISHDLDERNLRSLIHICGNYITGSRRDTIQDGLDVFRILKEQNVIAGSREKIPNLLQIVTEIKPRRKDIVRKVKEFIEETFQSPDVVVIAEFESSGDSDSAPKLDKDNTYNSYILPRFRFPNPGDCCAVDCCCFACNCHSPTVPVYVYVIFVIVFLLMAVVAALAWYSPVPKIYDYLSQGDRKRAGPYVVGLLCVIAMGCLIGAIIAYFRKRQRRYSYLSDDHNITPTAACSISSLPSIPPSDYYPRKDKRQKRSTAASSSVSTASVSVPSRHYPNGSVPIQGSGHNCSCLAEPDCSDPGAFVIKCSRPAYIRPGNNSGTSFTDGSKENLQPDSSLEEEKENLRHAQSNDTVSSTASGIFFR